MNPRNWKKTLLSIAGGLAVPVSIYTANATLPHTFSSGTPIRAEEVNANFTALRDAVNTKSDIVQNGAVSGQRLKLVGMTSSDGARFVSEDYTQNLLYDVALSMYCSPNDVLTSATTTEFLCLPAAYSFLRRATDDNGSGGGPYVFADSTCNTRFYLVDNDVPPAGLPPAQRYVYERDSNDIVRMYHLGQRVTSNSMTVYGNSDYDGGSAGCVSLGSRAVDFYVRGNELPLAQVARLNLAIL